MLGAMVVGLGVGFELGMGVGMGLGLGLGLPACRLELVLCGLVICGLGMATGFETVERARSPGYVAVVRSIWTGGKLTKEAYFVDGRGKRLTQGVGPAVEQVDVCEVGHVGAVDNPGCVTVQRKGLGNALEAGARKWEVLEDGRVVSVVALFSAGPETWDRPMC